VSDPLVVVGHVLRGAVPVPVFLFGHDKQRRREHISPLQHSRGHRANTPRWTGNAQPRTSLARAPWPLSHRPEGCRLVHIARATLMHVNSMQHASAHVADPAHCHLLAPFGVACQLKARGTPSSWLRGGKEYRTEPWAWSTTSILDSCAVAAHTEGHGEEKLTSRSPWRSGSRRTRQSRHQRCRTSRSSS
jgi:hypothetical protein